MSYEPKRTDDGLIAWMNAVETMTIAEAEWYAMFTADRDDRRDGDEPASGVRVGGPRPAPEPAACA